MLKKISFILTALLFYACASSGNGATGVKEPEWVKNPYAKYNRQNYLAAVGRGSSYELAENNALAKLISIFGQNVQFDEKLFTSYQDAMRNGVFVEWSENTSLSSAITTSANMENLVGAEFGDRWDNGKDYAVLVFLDKAKAIPMYTSMIKANQAIIQNLTNMPQNEKYTLNGLARYRYAATAADMVVSYNGLLSVVGGPVQPVKNGTEFRLEAQNIAKTIPVGVLIDNDMNGQIKGAFTKALTSAGFQTSSSNPPYLLNITVESMPVVSPDSPYKFTRVSVNADFIDSGLRSVLFHSSYETRRGHSIQSEADKQAFMAISSEIENEYPKDISDYLDGMKPKR